MVWQNKNNKLAFIEIKNTEALDAPLGSSISLFDVMTTASLHGVYNIIDWQSLELATKHLKLRIQEKLNQFSNFASDITKILKINLNVRNFDEKKLIIHRIVIDHLEIAFCCRVRVMPLSIKLKMAYCDMDLLFFINRCTFAGRYQALVDGINFRD